jgi:hypothetical protein
LSFPRVGLGTALEHEPHDLDRVRHAEQVGAIRLASDGELRVGIEQPGELVAVVGLDGAVREHERRRRLLAARRGGAGASSLGSRAGERGRGGHR